MWFLLSIVAIILFIVGIVRVVQGQILWGIALVVIALLIGPGGVSIWR